MSIVQKRGRAAARFALASAALTVVGVIRPAPALAAPVIFQNATTRLQVNGGEANNGLVPAGGYFDYTDLAKNELTSWSIDPVLVFPDAPKTAVFSNGSAGGFGSPTNLGNGVARSTGVGRGISVQADTELVGAIARTTFTFTSASSMNGVTFLYYAENDLFSAANDSATFIGSIANNDLALFQFDSATGNFFVKLTGKGLSNATLTRFGSGLWTQWGTSLEAGDLTVLSANGSNFATLGDLGQALAFSLAGTSASVVVDYQTVPEVPEPAALAVVGVIGAVAVTRRRRGGIRVVA